MIKSLSECRTACWIIIAIAAGGVVSEINRPSTSLVLFLSIIIAAGIAALSLGRDIQDLKDRDEAECQARHDQFERDAEKHKNLIKLH